jgi:hypothetical protein
MKVYDPDKVEPAQAVHDAIQVLNAAMKKAAAAELKIELRVLHRLNASGNGYLNDRGRDPAAHAAAQLVTRSHHRTGSLM